MSSLARPPLLPLVLLLGACPGGPKPDDDTGAPPQETAPPIGDAEAEQVLYLEDGPADLDLLADGRLAIVTRYGGHVLAWTPGEKATDTVQRSVAGLEGICVQGETIWAASSDGGIVGAVGWLEDGDLVTVASQADDGTLFRYPRDLVLAPDGKLLMADATVNALFRTDPTSGATTAYYLDIASPRALLFRGEQLYVGGSDGIFTVGYPGGTATRVDEREALGLLVVGDRLLATNAENKIFEVGGASLGGADLALPGGLMAIGDTLYVSDEGGRYLWSLALE